MHAPLLQVDFGRLQLARAPRMLPQFDFARLQTLSLLVMRRTVRL